MKENKTRHFETFWLYVTPNTYPHRGNWGNAPKNGAQLYSPIWV